MAYSREISVGKRVIKKVGIIDLDGLYKTMQRWFYDNKYYFDEPTSRIRPGSAAGVELEYDWRVWRKINDYAMHRIRVWFYLWDVKDIEVIKDGKKVKLTKCRLQIEFDGNIEIDYSKTYGKTWLGKLIFPIYNTLILQEEKVLSMWWDELYYRLYKLQTIAKEYLDMESKGNAYYDVW